jgi:hypothetical protein
MKFHFRDRVGGLARSLWRPRRRPTARPAVRPGLLHLEERALPSTLTVVNLDDGGAGSLRGELALAQDGDTVVFAPPLHGTLTLTSGELQVGQGVTIQGPGAGDLAINSGHAGRVFEVLGGADATISGLTITGGLACVPGPGAPAHSGGGIYVDRGASLTLTDSAVTGNTANAASAVVDFSAFVSGSGGGIYNAGALTLEGDTVANNVANSGFADGVELVVEGLGGGIYNAGTLTVADSVVSGNVANSGQAVAPAFGLADARGFGGGIYNGGALTLWQTTLDGNTANAGSSPGRIYAYGGALDSADYATLRLTDCSLVNNSANSAGGAAALYAGGGGLRVAGGTVRDSLVADNVVNSGSGIGADYLSGGGVDVTGRVTLQGTFILDNDVSTDPGPGWAAKGPYAVGGGIAVEDGAVLTLRRSVVTDNRSGDAPSDIAVLPGGQVNPASAHNIIGDGGSGGLVDGVNGNQVG